MWRSEDNLAKSVLSSYHAGPGAGTQVVRLGGVCFNIQSVLSCALSDAF